MNLLKSSHNTTLPIVPSGTNWIAFVMLVGAFFMPHNSSFYTRMVDLNKFIPASYYQKLKSKIERLSMPEPNTGCHIWIGIIDKAGYGRISIKEKNLMAHRVAYFLYKGDIPKNLVIDHLCNNTSCVNPDHLEAKTQRKNGLRASNSLTTINALKTHCKRGHEFTEENTYKVSEKNRGCRECAKEYKSEHYKKNKLKYSENSKVNYQKRKQKNHGQPTTIAAL